MDVGFRGSAVALGAALFNVRVAAAEHRILGPVNVAENVAGTPLQSPVTLQAPGDDPALAELYWPDAGS